jgi:hypothetical protein
MRRITHLHSVNEQDRKHIRRHVCLCASLTLTPRINIKKGKKYEHITVIVSERLGSNHTANNLAAIHKKRG